MVIVNYKDKKAGFLVDGVSDIYTIKESDIVKIMEKEVFK